MESLESKVLLTGATGFVGGRLAQLLEGTDLRCAVRREGTMVCGHEVVIPKLDITTDWSRALAGRNVVIHAAARAHVMNNEIDDPLNEYRKVNVDGTLKLARQAAKAGIRHFIFISSIGVNGNSNNYPFVEGDVPNPTELYAQSKWEAEQGLWKIQRNSGMAITIIRPPLVYGPNAPGNFGSLVNWIRKGVPLPLGAIRNSRTLVALDNLVDLIITCINHPAAANQLFLAGDDQDVSTTELLRGVGQAMGYSPSLIPVPSRMLMLGATLLGKKTVAQRLLSSLQVDISKARDLLGWKPPLTVKEGLCRCFISENDC